MLGRVSALEVVRAACTLTTTSMLGLALNTAVDDCCFMEVSFTEGIPEGLRYYLLILPFTLAVILVVSFVYATVTRTLFFEAFRWTLLGAVFLILLTGFAGFLPFSAFHYGLFNPAAKREQVKAVVKERQSRAGAVAFVLVGFTLLLIYLILFPY